MVHRMFAEWMEYHERYETVGCLEPDFLFRRLMVTVSPMLSEEIKRSYTDMVDTHIVGSVNDASVSDSRSDHDIMTFDEFLDIIDGKLANSFYANNQHRDEFGVNLQPVDFDNFSNLYYPRFSETFRDLFDSSQVYTEICTHIKGSVASLHSGKGYITEDEYISLADSRVSILDRDDRRDIYREFLNYEKWKGKDYSYDLMDVVHHVYKCLEKDGYKGRGWSSVYIDEVQDLTPAQLSLFRFVCGGLDRFVFAGDTAQTVSTVCICFFQSFADYLFHHFV